MAERNEDAEDIRRAERERCRKAICEECRTGSVITRDGPYYVHGVHRQIICKAGGIWNLEPIAGGVRAGIWVEVNVAGTWLLALCVNVDGSIATVNYNGLPVQKDISSIREVLR